jgi:cation diffusion facilitator family transporter
VFLVAYRVRRFRPDERFPYGYHRVVTIAFLCASLALFAMGGFLLVDAVLKLVRQEHPTIGTVVVFGQPIWLGWLMLPALLWSAVPAVFLGRAKLPLARALHDKVLFADAQMNKADWMTAAAAMAGVIGIGCGLWWADAAAAALISASILRDGWSNLSAAVTDLMDRRPETVDHEAIDPLTARLATELERLEWVKEAKVRLREAGHVFFGEAFVVPADERELVSRIEAATELAYALDWRLHDLVIYPVRSVEGPTGRRGAA